MRFRNYNRGKKQAPKKKKRVFDPTAAGFTNDHLSTCTQRIHPACLPSKRACKLINTNSQTQTHARTVNNQQNVPNSCSPS